ncbi:MAG: hypothetical protein JJ855_00820 [Rhodospirillales bacterium]|nr:hypothetical protein [Rhodospirillales bacterium]
MFELFTRHPRSVGETYLEHMRMASGFAGSLLVATVVCSIHALFPFLFEKTGSRIIADLYQRTGPGRVQADKMSQIPKNA